MITKKITGLLALVALTISVFGAEAGFGVEVGVGVQESTKQIKDTDYQIKDDPEVVLSDFYGDTDKYIAFTITTEMLGSDTPVQLQIGPTFHFRKNLKYDVDFVAKVIVPNVFNSELDFKIGGLFGLGKVKTSVSTVEVDNFLLNGTTTQTINNTASFYKWGITTGIAYPIYEGIELFVNIDWINRKYDFRQDLEGANGNGGDKKAAQLAMENYKIESLATSIGISYTF
jgi:hypothetical protein